MGSNESKPTGVSPTQQPSAPASACPVKHNQLPTAGAVEEASKGTCPISFFSNSSVNQEKSSCPVTGSSGQNQEQKSACPIKGNNGQKLEQSACPVKGNNGQTYKNPSVFNVYSTKIDPSNQMPASANQKPAPNQEAPLSVERVRSSIPKGGTEEETWTYPSPQMFWNALVRKDKTEGVSEKDMDTVIAIHNNMNENTWQQVVEWEMLINDPEKVEPGRESKLLKFCGRPDELSPKARLKMLFGHPAPFDRHDWTIDRGGKEVRYIIDYYHDESAVQRDKTPKHMTDPASMQSIKVDVRPALDSPASIFARVVLMPFMQMRGSTNYNPPPFFAPKVMLKAEEGKVQRINQDWAEIAKKCAAKKDALTTCKSEEECRAASVALQVCTASVVCPSVAAAFLECTTGNDGGKKKDVDMAKAGAAFSAVVQCLELFEIDSLKLIGKESSEVEKKISK